MTKNYHNNYQKYLLLIVHQFFLHFIETEKSDNGARFKMSEEYIFFISRSLTYFALLIPYNTSFQN